MASVQLVAHGLPLGVRDLFASGGVGRHDGVDQLADLLYLAALLVDQLAGLSRIAVAPGARPPRPEGA